MGRKETASAEDLMTVIGILEESRITYWIDGGWGVDILAGEQTRAHRDIDIDFDAREAGKLLAILTGCGYAVDTDEAPVRIELYSGKLGYLDIHPFVLNEDGTAKQANSEGGWYEFGADCFGTGIFKERVIHCISAKGQKIFHTGYKLRDVDVHDLKIIERLLNLL